MIAQSRLGRQLSRLRQHNSAEPNSKVHRFKVDKRRGFIVSTYSEGSLNVTDLTTGESLWAFDKVRFIQVSSSYFICNLWHLYYVRWYVHCEYGEGFVVFDRMDGLKKVWCLASEYDTSPPPENSLPDSRQPDACTQSSSLYPFSRVRFRPTHANLHACLRFIYSSLLVSAADQAFVFNIP